MTPNIAPEKLFLRWPVYLFLGLGLPGGYDGPRASFAWYRLALNVPLLHLDSDEPRLAISIGKVDSAYEVYASGVRLGGVGALPPQPRSDYDRHAVYVIPRHTIDARGRVVIAIRVWKSAETNSRTGGLVEGPFLAGSFAALRPVRWQRPQSILSEAGTTVGRVASAVPAAESAATCISG